MNERTLILIGFTMIGAIAVIIFFPKAGQALLGIINQIKNWFKIILYSTFSKATQGTIEYL